MNSYQQPTVEKAFAPQGFKEFASPSAIRSKSNIPEITPLSNKSQHVSKLNN